MKLERVKNTKRGIKHGLVAKMIGMILAFLVQSIIIRKVGIEYAGVNGLFGSILSVLSLAELGVGSAVVYAMYKPIAEDDVESICSLINLYRRVYRYIGMIVLILGLAITPFLNILVKGEYPPDLNITIVFLLFLSNTVISYWLFAYKSCLLVAYQRNDISSIISTIVSVVISSCQVIVLLLFKNYYVFLSTLIAGTIINNIISSKVVDRMFPEIKCRGTVPREALTDIRKQISGLFIGKICGVTRNSFDSIFMSAFLGLTQTAIYNNYYHIITSCNAVLNIALSSLAAGIGNGIALNNPEKNYNEMMMLNNIYLVISGVMTSVMVCLYQPFMSIWVGKEYLFPEYTMVLFPLYFYITKMGDIRSLYSDGAGLFWADRWRNILEAVTNMILNYYLGKTYGAFGIVLATLISLFSIGFIGGAIVVFKHYFKTGYKKYFENQLILLLSTIAISFLCYCICKRIIIQNEVINILVRALVCLSIVPTIYWLCFRKTKGYYEVKGFCFKHFSFLRKNQ